MFMPSTTAKVELAQKFLELKQNVGFLSALEIVRLKKHNPFSDSRSGFARVSQLVYPTSRNQDNCYPIVRVTDNSVIDYGRNHRALSLGEWLKANINFKMFNIYSSIGFAILDFDSLTLFKHVLPHDHSNIGRNSIINGALGLHIPRKDIGVVNVEFAAIKEQFDNWICKNI